MQGLGSDKTFHLKWNNHLQNLSQLFTTIYSSSALADVTLSCRDGTLKAHKLVLSACSPYFEQIFRDNPCQHPIVILKGIPFSEINLLVEFMYKGSVDVQELDLQSLMHTASELEIRGLAYEARDNAAQLLNVNLEYPTYTQTQVPQAQTQAFPQARTDVERLKQIHLYQQSMMRAEEIRRRRRDDTPGTHTAVNNILAAAAREMEEARRGERVVASIQTELDQAVTSTPEPKNDEERPKKRTSILTPEDDKLRAKKKMTVRFQDERDERPNKVTSPGAANEHKGDDPKPGGIKVVQLSALQKPTNNDHDDSDEKAKNMDDDEETDSSGSMSDSATNDCEEGRRPHVCDICDLRFQRSSHLSRHRLTHTGERPFTCGGCGRSFARSDKLRVHTKICEREDPTVDMANESTAKREANSEVMSGMVRTTHRESGHLVFTPSGDVMLPPRTPVVLNSTLEPVTNELQQGDLVEPPRRGRGRPRKTPLPLTPKIKKKRGRPPKTSLVNSPVVLNSTLEPVTNEIQQGDLVEPPRRGRGRPRKTPLTPKIKKKRGRPPKTSLVLNSTLEPVKSEIQQGDLVEPPRRGRGRPRKTPLPLTPKIKKKRGRPPKTSLDLEGCVLTSGTVMGLSQVPAMAPSGTQLMLKRRRGRPPKNYMPTRPDGRPNENYNATNLPFGDFSYLTEMMYNPALAAYGYGGAADPDRSADADPADTSHERTIDVSSSEEDEEDSRVEPEENVPPVAVETQIMTVGDCQIVKLPPTEEGEKEKEPPPENPAPPAAPSAVTITPITTVGDCTIRPVENNT